MSPHLQAQAPIVAAIRRQVLQERRPATSVGRTLAELDVLDRIARRCGGEHWWTCKTDNIGIGATRTV